MTPNEVERAAFLMRAKKGIGEMREAAKRTEPDPLAGDYRSLQISVGDYGDGGGSIDAWADFTLDDGKELIDFAEEIVNRGLAALGVEIDK